MRALIVVNERSRLGGRYPSIAKALERGLVVSRVGFDADWRRALDEARFDLVVAAGGDGTVSAVASALVERDLDVPLGAVALGTSNDFHKPFGHRVCGVPVRTEPRGRRRADVGVAAYEDELGRVHRRVFVVSASLGATARGNRIFSERTRAARSGAWAITSAAVEAIATQANLDATVDGRRVSLTNLSVSKTAWLTGGLRYDDEVRPGLLSVHLCEGMSPARLLCTLLSMARGRFRGLPGTSSAHAARLVVELDAPADLELDGELVRACKVSFEVLPERLWVCT